MRYIDSLAERFSLQKSLFISVFWGTTAGTLGMGMNFVINILAARILGNSLGELTLFISANNILLALTLFGLNPMATVFISKALNDKAWLSAILSNINGIALYSSLLLTAVVLCLNILPGHPFKIWHTSSALVVLFALLWFIFSARELIQTVILNGFTEFRKLAHYSLLKAIIALFIMYLFLKRWGVEGGIAGYALSSISGSFLIGWFLRQRYRQEGIIVRFFPKVRLSVLSTLLKQSLPVFLASLIMAPAIWFSNYLVFMEPSGAPALSVFTIASQWMLVIQFLPIQISKVILPWLSARHGTIDFSTIRRTGLITSLAITVIMIVLSMVFEQLIVEIFHFNVSETRTPMRIMFVVAFFATINTVYSQSVLSEGNAWIRVISDGFMALSLVGVTLAMIRIDLFLALPVASLVSYIAGVFVLITLSKLKK